MLGIPDKIDIVFALDGSDGVSHASFGAQKDFIKGTLKAYEIASDKTRAGFLTYGSKAVLGIKVKDGVSQSAIDGQLRHATKVGGVRQMANAMRFAGSEIFDETSSGRGRKLLVILVAGIRSIAPDDDLKRSLDEMKNRGIEVLVIGVEENVHADKLGEIMKEGAIKKVKNTDHLNRKLTDVVEASEKLTGWYLW